MTQIMCKKTSFLGDPAKQEAPQDKKKLGLCLQDKTCFDKKLGLYLRDKGSFD